MLERIQSLVPIRTRKGSRFSGQVGDTFDHFSHEALEPCRQKVAEYINRRDGALVPAADPEDRCACSMFFQLLISLFFSPPLLI